MTAGLGIDRLLDILIECFWWFIPFTVINHYEQAVVLQFGKFSRLLHPGFHFIIPFGIEEVITENIKPDGYDAAPITIVLRDGTSVSVSFVIIWEVTDVKQLVLEVEDKPTVLSGIVGYVQEWFSKHSLEELSLIRNRNAECGKYHGIREKLIKHVNGELEWAGVKVTDLLLRDFAVTSLRDGVVRVISND